MYYVRASCGQRWLLSQIVYTWFFSRLMFLLDHLNRYSFLLVNHIRNCQLRLAEESSVGFVR